jgi:hypothetical protein
MGSGTRKPTRPAPSGTTLWRAVKISPPSSGKDFRNVNEPYRYQVTATTQQHTIDQSMLSNHTNTILCATRCSHKNPNGLFLDYKYQVRWRWLTLPLNQEAFCPFLLCKRVDNEHKKKSD